MASIAIQEQWGDWPQGRCSGSGFSRELADGASVLDAHLGI